MCSGVVESLYSELFRNSLADLSYNPLLNNAVALRLKPKSPR